MGAPDWPSLAAQECCRILQQPQSWTAQRKKQKIREHVKKRSTPRLSASAAAGRFSPVHLLEKKRPSTQIRQWGGEREGEVWRRLLARSVCEALRHTLPVRIE